MEILLLEVHETVAILKNSVQNNGETSNWRINAGQNENTETLVFVT
jgi:hypothetical protein